MIALKKLYGDELLRLALMLSLLRADPEQYLRLDETRSLAGGLVNGTERSPEISSFYHRPRALHPKSIDSILFDYERDIFDEMMSLGRWGRNERSNREAVQTYLLNGVESANVQQQTAAVAQNAPSQDLYSHLPVAQMDDDQVQQCVTVKTEDDNSDGELGDASFTTPQSEFQEEVEIKTEEDDADASGGFYRPSTLLGPSYIRNLSTFDGPLMEEDSAASIPFDVAQFFANPPLKTEPKSSNNFFADDNALDDFMPFYMRNGCEDSIAHQNLADLKDFDETPETMMKFKKQLERLDLKQQPENFDKYLIENDNMEQGLENAFGIKRERASTSFTSVTSSCATADTLEASVSGSSSAGDEALLVDFGEFKIERDEGLYSGDELSPEDMDLIEVLWKQDVDMGFSLNQNSAQENLLNGDSKYPDAVCPFSPDGTSFGATQLNDDLELEKLKSCLKGACEDFKKAEDNADKDSDPNINNPWSGLPYTIDLETGEYVLSDELERFDFEEALQLVDADDATASNLAELKLENSELNSQERKQEQESEEMLAPRYHPHAHPHAHGGSEHMHHPLGPPPSSDHSQQHHHAHHHFAAAYHHQNLVRSVSMEQRWQDLAALLALPGPNGSGPTDPHHHHLYQQHHHHHVNSTLGHCSQAPSTYVGPPYAPLSAEKPPSDIYGGSNLGSAVAASMNVSHSSSGCTASGGGPPPFYKPEHPTHDHQSDPIYYQNGTTELNGTSDGFLSSILNEEDLQLMDMAMNEGMYTMRMLESGATANGTGVLPMHLPHQTQTPLAVSSHHMTMGTERIDASSDSAVSSMGSERVPSLSDGEWCDAGSDSAQEYHGKMRPCESESRQQPLVAQKKHHMFGKRCFQEQTALGRLRSNGHDDHPMSDVKFEYEHPSSASAVTYIPDVGHMAPEMKYSYTMEFTAGGAGVGVTPAAGSLRHNHTYSLPPAPPQPPHRPLARDKRGRRGPDTPALPACGTQGPLSRDEKKARALGIPLNVHDIINLPMDEFNERLSKHDLSETQLSLIRDIRRRGKNKVAAQNCRKRKLDQITSLADEVRDARLRKQRLQRDRHLLLTQRQRAKEHFAALYRHVFQHLRDADGNPLSSQQYSLQQAADGAVVLVPRASASLLPDSRSPRPTERHLSTNGTSDDDMERIKIKQRKSFDQ